MVIISEYPLFKTRYIHRAGSILASWSAMVVLLVVVAVVATADASTTDDVHHHHHTTPLLTPDTARRHDP